MFPGHHTLFRCHWQSPGLHPLLDFYFQQASLWSVQKTGAETESLVGGQTGGERQTETESCDGETTVPDSQCGRPGPAGQEVLQHAGLAGPGQGQESVRSKPSQHQHPGHHSQGGGGEVAHPHRGVSGSGTGETTHLELLFVSLRSLRNEMMWR